MASEIERAAADILEAEAWFNGLPAAKKDALSQPNHDYQQARKGLELARLVIFRRLIEEDQHG